MEHKKLIRENLQRFLKTVIW